MNAHRIEMIMPEDEKLTLEGLPFRAGTSVVIIVLEKDNSTKEASETSNSLHGSVLRYDDPFESVVPQNERKVLHQD